MAKIKTAKQAEDWIRKNKKYISLKQLCDDAGISYTSFKHYLNDVRDPVGRPKGSYTQETAEKLIKKLNEILEI